MASLIYPCFLVSHCCYPNNDQIPLYFEQQLCVKILLGKVVNYIYLPSDLGQRHGRLVDRQPGHPPWTHRLIFKERAPTISPILGSLVDEAMHRTQLHEVI